MDVGTSETTRLTVPEPLVVCEARMHDGTVIMLRRHGNPDGPRVVLSHANGFAADAYFPFWSLFLDRFDLVLYDFRNHGWNSVGPIEAHNIATFVDDNQCIAREIDEHFGAKPRIGVFHSLSAQAAAIEACSVSGSYAALVLFEPFICPPGCDPEHKERLRIAMESMSKVAYRRRESFDSKEAFAVRLRRIPNMQRLRPGTVELMADATLCAAPDGGYQLRCPREYEARINEQGFEYAKSVDIEALSCPVKLVGSDPVAPNTFLPTVSMDEILALNFDFVPETTHFLQLEEPEACLAAVLEFVAQV